MYVQFTTLKMKDPNAFVKMPFLKKQWRICYIQIKADQT